MSALITVENLKVHFTVGGRGLFRRSTGLLRAVDGIDLAIMQGESLGLVGESGSGKTTFGRALLRALKLTAGKIVFHQSPEDVIVTDLPGGALRRFRRHMQMIFQDPYASLNPRMTVRDIIAEPLIIQTDIRGEALTKKITAIAEKCGLAREHLGRQPHAFSGGQRQRIAIARALVLKPQFVVCDEPISALDVSIQAQILNLMTELRRELGLTYLFIAHDLAAVIRTCERIAVMYLGRIVEISQSKNICLNPRHPYSMGLISAVPIPDPHQRLQPILMEGESPDPANPPSGCRFHTRCHYAVDRCYTESPLLVETTHGHLVACHRVDDPDLRGPGAGQAQPEVSA
jgi:oligopeptide/dipeptide ABC transporter ATP-binding protein